MRNSASALNSTFARSVLAKSAEFLAQTSPASFADKLRNPVFIIGCGRSGTTLLVKTMALHDSIATYPNEANHLWHPETYPWAGSVHRAYIPPFGFDPISFTELSLEQRHGHRLEQIRAAFGAYQFLMRRPYFLNKSAMITFMIPQILETFPEAKLVYMVRDGRAVVLSWVRKDWRKIEKSAQAYKAHGIDVSFDGLLRAYAQAWKLHIQEVERQRVALELDEKGVLFELRYEDLCQSPRALLKEIAQFLGISVSAFDTVDFSHIESMNHKYRDRLDRETIQLMTQGLEPCLTQKGYR